MRAPKRRLSSAIFLLVSIFGLAISLIPVARSVPSSEGSAARRTVIAFIYGSVCVVGIVAALFPVACRGVLGVRRSFLENETSLQTRTTRVLGCLVLHGHHQLGPQAIVHELRFQGKSYCANCYGLLAGAVVAGLTVMAFVLSGWPAGVDVRLTQTTYLVGLLGVALGFVQTVASGVGPRVRFVLSAAFVVGTSLMMIATDVLVSSLVADFFVVLLTVFWLFWRISISDPDAS